METGKVNDRRYKKFIVPIRITSLSEESPNILSIEDFDNRPIVTSFYPRHHMRQTVGRTIGLKSVTLNDLVDNRYSPPVKQRECIYQVEICLNDKFCTPVPKGHPNYQDGAYFLPRVFPYWRCRKFRPKSIGFIIYCCLAPECDNRNICDEIK